MLINITIPPNAMKFLSYLLIIAAFDIIPTDEPYDDWFDFLLFNLPLSVNFEATGYESMFFIRNLGSISIFMCFIPL